MPHRRLDAPTVLQASRGPVPAPGMPGVLLLHGFTSTPASMAPVAEVLRDAGCAVHVPMLPGHGTRWQDLNTTSAEQILRAALAGWDRLAARRRQVAVVGLSMGGALALHVAARRSPSAVVAINPCLRLKPFQLTLARLLGGVLPSTTPVGGDIARPGTVEEAYDRTPVRAVATLGRLIAQVRGELDDVRAPVLLLRSARDNVLPRSSADTLVNNMDPGQLTEVVLERSLHVATLDHDADAVGWRTLEFLRDAARSGEPQAGP
ncbi:alpha/beta hydrolase [Nesterenkonia sp. HG001]|uniref:alpha/beta hydrolase n=1 Tax=Nesterenkonia sp. HG001 TaxID=2983207 RepID=UPI002AC7383A|nr:alpha/beta fold hydrolase [Nesterenkonia sp. HG001]MDZ5075991.1 alpha/beta fold hydrolase [Nesterenkonia sp. HG001]